ANGEVAALFLELLLKDADLATGGRDSSRRSRCDLGSCNGLHRAKEFPIELGERGNVLAVRIAIEHAEQLVTSKGVTYPGVVDALAKCARDQVRRERAIVGSVHESAATCVAECTRRGQIRVPGAELVQ